MGLPDVRDQLIAGGQPRAAIPCGTSNSNEKPVKRQYGRSKSFGDVCDDLLPRICENVLLSRRRRDVLPVQGRRLLF